MRTFDRIGTLVAPVVLFGILARVLYVSVGLGTTVLVLAVTSEGWLKWFRRT